MGHREWEEKTTVPCPFCWETVPGVIKWSEDDDDKTKRGFSTPEGHPYAWPGSALIHEDDHCCLGMQGCLKDEKNRRDSVATLAATVSAPIELVEKAFAHGCRTKEDVQAWINL